jgi:hypothetical protein
MFFRQIYDEKLAQAAYVIGCQKTGEAIVIDPERDIDRYEALAKANGLRIVAAADTHIHADFLSGVREFAEKGARAYLSDEGDADWKYQWLDKKSLGGRYDAVLLKDGDIFSIGNIQFRAIHTPGHTPEHLCFEVTDRGGGATEPMGIATGDFVFVGHRVAVAIHPQVGSVGRDFLGFAFEEPENCGAWQSMLGKFLTHLGSTPSYVGRPAQSSSAVGSTKRHAKEQAKIVAAALGAPAGGTVGNKDSAGKSSAATQNPSSGKGRSAH